MIDKTEKEIMANWTNEDIDNPSVSIFCLAYNHENFISEALDGFLMQETNFGFEIIIHDDASTDRTAEIIRGYAEKYPNIIKPVFQEVNQYSMGVKIFETHLYPKAKGKYYAYCDGDDYWTSKDKLQQQYDVMEENPDYSMCVHNTLIHYLDEPKNDDYFNKTEKNHILSREEVFLEWNVHTSSYFCRVVDDDRFDSLNLYWFGDYVILTIAYFYGQIYYIDSAMSVYNKGLHGDMMRRKKGDIEILIRESRLRINYLEEYNELTEGIYSDAVNKRIKELNRVWNKVEFKSYLKQFKAIKETGSRKDIKEMAKTITRHPYFETFLNEKRGVQKVKRYIKYKWHIGLM